MWNSASILALNLLARTRVSELVKAALAFCLRPLAAGEVNSASPAFFRFYFAL